LETLKTSNKKNSTWCLDLQGRKRFCIAPQSLLYSRRPKANNLEADDQQLTMKINYEYHINYALVKGQNMMHAQQVVITMQQT
jgi:hypothetical protein